jgi:hypothetical protein
MNTPGLQSDGLHLCRSQLLQNARTEKVVRANFISPHRRLSVTESLNPLKPIRCAKWGFPPKTHHSLLVAFEFFPFPTKICTF